MLVNLADKFLMVDVTSTNDNDVIAEVVGGVELSQVISSEGMEDVSVSLLGLAHHVLSEDVEMGVLNGGLEVSVVVVFMLLAYFLLHKLEFVFIQDAVGDGVAEKLDCLVDVVLEHLESEVSDFTASVISLDGAH
jgi:hypothetical protein